MIDECDSLRNQEKRRKDKEKNIMWFNDYTSLITLLFEKH